MAATWREHLRANPVPRGQQVLFLRHMLAAGGGEATTPAHAALILDLKRRYLEMRPRLRRIYSLAADPAAALSQFAPLGFARLPEGIAEIGGPPTTPSTTTSGRPPSTAADRPRRAGMLIDSDALLDPDRRQLILDGIRADLTKLEFDVLQYLHEREGRVVGRAALLRDVWGYDWSGGSNVVEVVISALRRKLGDRAGSLQTVRGAGYRFTAPHRDGPGSGCPGSRRGFWPVRAESFFQEAGIGEVAVVETWAGDQGWTGGISSSEAADDLSALVAVAEQARQAIMESLEYQSTGRVWPACPAHGLGRHPGHVGASASGGVTGAMATCRRRSATGGAAAVPVIWPGPVRRRAGFWLCSGNRGVPRPGTGISQPGFAF